MESQEHLQQQQPQKRGARASEVHKPQPETEVQNPHPPPSHQNCPRCDSSNTKFCYYNNYSLTQPRHFCKSCRRYWTQGGTLRNVPIGGGCRKPKRAKNSSTASAGNIVVSQPETTTPNPNPITAGMDLGPAAMPTPMVDPNFSSRTLLSTFPQLLPVNGPGAIGGATGGGSQFGTNLSSIQGLNIPYWKPEIEQFQPQGEVFPLRTMSSWTQRFFNGSGPTSSSTGNSSFWVGATFDGRDQVGPSTSFNQNQWSSDNKNTGY